MKSWKENNVLLKNNFSRITELKELDKEFENSSEKYGLEKLDEGIDYKYIGEGYNKRIGPYKMYQPLTYKGSRILASNEVPPVKKNGAEWLISSQRTARYWDNSARRGIIFLFLLTKTTKYVVKRYPNNILELYSFGNRKMGFPAWLKEDAAIIEGTGLPAFIKVEEAITVNSDGSISLLKKDIKGSIYPADLNSYIWNHAVDGEFDVKFKRWEADFNCRGILTLKGAPEYVDGDFSCSFNHIDSLDGAPEYVRGNFDCISCNDLKSLEGAPKRVDGNFRCIFCENLASLKGAPKYVGGNFDCRKTPSLKSLKELSTHVGGEILTDLKQE